MSDPATPAFRAQFGEDRILAAHFGDRRSGFYVEVGAYDGLDGSATAYFEQIGWDGILIEADPDLAQRCRESRPRAKTFQCAVVAPGGPEKVDFEILDGSPQLSALAVGRDALQLVDHIADEVRIRRVTVEARTIDDVLENADSPPIDFITIDVNGYEWDALQGLTLERWRPELIIVERLTHLPDRRILRRMRVGGYAYRRTTGVNDWFIRTSDPSALGLRYRVRLLLGFFLPRYLTVYMPLLRGPGKRSVKRVLERLGLLPIVREMLNRNG